MSNTNTSKRNSKGIGTIIAIIISIGMPIGVGIFLKNKSVWASNSGNFTASILSWVFAAVIVVSMAIALIEVISTQKSNSSINGWVKKFCPEWLHKVFKNFSLLVFYPVIILAIPYYLVAQFQGALDIDLPFYVVPIIVLLVFFVPQLIAAYSFNTSKYLQYFLGFVKFIPILIVPIISFILADKSNINIASQEFESNAKGFQTTSAFFGMSLAIPAIFFAFDGFYNITNMRNRLKDPKKLGLIIFWALLFIAALYVIISSSIFLSSTDGTFSGSKPNSWISESALNKIKLTVNIFLIVAILGVYNGYSMGTFQTYDDTINDSNYDEYVLIRITRRIKIKGLTEGWKILTVMTLFYWLLSFSFGMFLFDYTLMNGGSSDGKSPNYIYSNNYGAFIDFISNWSSLILFFFIATAILGALINRKTKKVETIKNKFFIPAAIISVIGVYTFSIFYIIINIANIFYNNYEDWLKNFILVMYLLLTILLSFSTLIIDKYKSKNKKVQNIEKR
jgi:basic amino acid/polyamine antiporter, APA family